MGGIVTTITLRMPLIFATEYTYIYIDVLPVVRRECVPVVKRVLRSSDKIADEILGDDIFRMLVVVVLDTTDGDT